MTAFTTFVEQFSDIVWNSFLLFLLVGTGIFFTIRLRGVQVRRFGEGFRRVFGGFGPIFIAVCMFFFAFSTIIGWYFFGQSNFKTLFGEKILPVYSLIVVVFILVGSTLKVDLVWALADLFNGLMAVPNLLALLALSGVVVAIDRK